MGGVPNAPGPLSTLGSLGPSHQWRHKSRASLRDSLVPMVLRALLEQRCATIHHAAATVLATAKHGGKDEIAHLVPNRLHHWHALFGRLLEPHASAEAPRLPPSSDPLLSSLSRCSNLFSLDVVPHSMQFAVAALLDRTRLVAALGRAASGCVISAASSDIVEGSALAPSLRAGIASLVDSYVPKFLTKEAFPLTGNRCRCCYHRNRPLCPLWSPRQCCSAPVIARCSHL